MIGAMTLETWTVLGTWAAAIAAVAAVMVAYWQLSNLNETLRMNALSVVLQLECEMNARKQKVDEVAARIRTECQNPEPNTAVVDVWNDEMNGYFENWLNSADRLAFCIRRGYLPERDWKTEYRDYFQTLVRQHADRFGPASIYTNIIDLNHKWSRE